MMKTKITRLVYVLSVVFVVAWALFGLRAAFMGFGLGSLFVFMCIWTIGLAFCERSKSR